VSTSLTGCGVFMLRCDKLAGGAQSEFFYVFLFFELIDTSIRHRKTLLKNCVRRQKLMTALTDINVTRAYTNKKIKHRTCK